MSWDIDRVKQELRGPVALAVPPFNEDLSLNLDAFREHIRFMIAGGRAPVVILRDVVERQGRSILDLLEREAGLDVGNARNPGQAVHQKAMVAGEIRRDDPHQIVRLAGHQVALHDLRLLLHGGLEHLQGLLPLLVERHLDERADLQTRRVGIDESDLAPDDPAPHQLPHSPEARRRREPDGARELDVGHARILLELSEDAHIELVEQ